MNIALSRSSIRRRTVGAIAAACLAAAVAVSGCGGGNMNDPVAQAAVAKAATVSNQGPGLRVRFSMQFSAAALPGPITVRGAGASDTVRRTGSFNMAMDFGSIPQAVQTLGVSTVRFEMIEDRQTVYVKTVPRSVAQSVGVASGKPWAKTDLAGVAALTGSSLSSLTGNAAWSDPASLVGYLRATSGVTKVGRESVDGVKTTRYRAQIQLDRVPATLPPASRPQGRKTISSFAKVGIHVLPVNVWIDGQHRVRRMSFKVKGRQSLSLALRFDIPQYGRQPAPHLPPARQVADVKAG